MIAELWESFPRLLERNIDGLLETARPTPTKAFQLYKACQHEELWGGTFEDFRRRVEDFFARPRAQRRKSALDACLERPAPRAIFESFHLNFRSGAVSEGALRDLVTWAHHLIRVGYKTTSAVISIEVLGQTMKRLVTPGPLDKAEGLEFEDFCVAWKKTVFRLLGNRHDDELEAIVRELRWLNEQLIEAERHARERSVPTIYLTQTEIDWTLAVRAAAEAYLPLPRFPLSRGPQKQRLVELERACSLYGIVQATRLPELLKHRENIRATILARCDGLLRDKAA